MTTNNEQSAQPNDETLTESGEHNDEKSDEQGEGSGWTTTKAAAKVLGVSRRMVQEYVRRGDLAAQVEGSGVAKKYYVSIDSLNALRNRRMHEAKKSTNFADDSPTVQDTANLGEVSSEVVGEVLRQVIDRLEIRTAEAADLRARLELTERTESTLRENLERERERADRLEAELHTALQARRGWLRRFLGF